MDLICLPCLPSRRTGPRYRAHCVRETGPLGWGPVVTVYRLFARGLSRRVTAPARTNTRHTDDPQQQHDAHWNSNDSHPSMSFSWYLDRSMIEVRLLNFSEGPFAYSCKHQTPADGTREPPCVLSDINRARMSQLQWPRGPFGFFT